MAAKDFYHDHVRNALMKDGWTITHDPLPLKWGAKEVLVDMGAEQLLIAERASRKIAVEVKSFVSASEMRDLYNALGQFILYRAALALEEPERELFLAIRETTYFRLFDPPEGQLLLVREGIHVIVFDSNTQEIVRWIP